VACVFADMVEAENLVVDKTLAYVEQPPSEKYPAKEGAATDRPAPIGGPPPQNPQADDDGDPCSGVEETIRERVVLKSCHGRLGVVALAAEQVVPLKDLVEDDAVHKAAESDAEQDSGCARPRPGLMAFATLSSRARRDPESHLLRWCAQPWPTKPYVLGGAAPEGSTSHKDEPDAPRLSVRRAVFIAEGPHPMLRE
jgi:hypothetical protein